MRRGLGIGLAALALAGCGGGSGLQGTLEWEGEPTRSGRVVEGKLRNATSNRVTVEPSSMRLLDAEGRRVDARIRVGSRALGAGQATPVRVRWRKGEPTRLDYGAGTLQLPSG